MSYSNYDSALVKLNKAIVSKPDFIEAYQARIKCYQSLNQPENAKKDSITLAGIKTDEKAEKLFRDNLKKNETEVNKISTVLHTECYYKDARGWFELYKKGIGYDGKRDFIDKVLENDSTNVEYYIAFGDFYRDRGYEFMAEKMFNKALSLNPKCEWYDRVEDKMLTCGNCNGKGYRLQVNITQQKVNNTTHSTSDSERITCTQCFQGYVKGQATYKSLRLPK
jgi:tetratricopeptide (TPR) repeat protein